MKLSYRDAKEGRGMLYEKVHTTNSIAANVDELLAPNETGETCASDRAGSAKINLRSSRREHILVLTNGRSVTR